MPRRPLRTPSELASAGFIAADRVADLDRVAARYAVAVTPDMAALIDRRDANDPIARQFMPDARELDTHPDDRADPIGDATHEKLPGLIHRYPDRVLLKLTHACPVYCRFCFRREVVGPGGETMLAGDALEQALAYLAARPAIREVILTGGDPLILAPRRIAEITQRLSAIAHLDILRWHSRVPVVAPDRVTAELVAALRSEAKAVYIGIHANHPRELTSAARHAIRQLGDAGLGLVSQTVLLKGVNDDAAILVELFRAFVTLRVRPYYLHHADLAPGTAHFRTTIAEGQALMRALRGRVSGLALPTYILDIPGGFGKVPVGPAYVDAATGAITDIDGGVHPPSSSEA
ncbi:MAG: lysine-2,3-aminomutase-like protein [Hyphomicrobiaceae bacterium]